MPDAQHWSGTVTNTDLIERLESTTEGSRRLDMEIFCAIAISPFDIVEGHVTTVMGGFAANITDEDIPHYTTSLDAVLTLFETEVHGLVALWSILVREDIWGEGFSKDHICCLVCGESIEAKETDNA